MNSSSREQIHFVTGKLAEAAVRSTLRSWRLEIGFEYHSSYADHRRRFDDAEMVPAPYSDSDGTSRVVVPGYLQDGLEDLQKEVQVRIECGPRDIRELPSISARKSYAATTTVGHSIAILAEINFAPRWRSTSL